MQRIGLFVCALTLVASSIFTLPALDAHASVPQYGEETVGFGNRQAARTGGGIAFDSVGNFYVSISAGNDSFIRKFAADGTFIKDIQAASPTIAINSDYGRMAVDASNNLYAINKNGNNIHVFDSTGAYQTAIAGAFANADIVFDHADNYYLTNTASHRVRKFSHSGTWLYDIGGPSSGTADGKFNTPGELAVDSNNNLVVIDKNNNRIQIFSSTGSFIRKFGQKNTSITCPAQPSLGSMAGIALDTTDNIYVATHDGFCNNLVQKFTIDGSYIETQSRPNATSYMRRGDNNIFYDLESGPGTSLKVSRYDTAGTPVGTPVVGDTNVLLQPTAVTQDAQGNIYVADSMYKHIKKYDPSRALVAMFGSSGTGNGQFQAVSGLAYDSANNVIYVTDSVSNKIQKFTTDGSYVSHFTVSSGSSDGQFGYGPTTMLVRTDGNLLIQDGPTGNLQTLSPTGSFVSKFPDTYVYNFAQKSDGTILVHSGYSSAVFNFYNTSNSLIYSRYDSFYDEDSGIAFTLGRGYGYTLAYDSSDNLYATGRESNRNSYYRSSLARINLDHEDLPFFTIINQSVDPSSGLYVTPSRELLVTDPNRNVVRSFVPSALIEAPSAPTSLTASSNQSSSITASWQAPATGGPISKYRIDYKPHTLNSWIKYGTTTSLNATLTGLLADTYDIRVTAINDAGAGAAIQANALAVESGYAYKEYYSSSDTIRPGGITFDSTGNRYETDPDNSRINMYSAAGTFVRSFGEDQVINPAQPAISSDNKLYVPDKGDDSVKIFALDGTYLSSFGTFGTGDGEMYNPAQVVIDKDDNIYVVSTYRNIQKYDKNGTYLGRLASDITDPSALAIASDGSFFVANNTYDSDGGVIKYDSTGARVGLIIDYGWEEGDSKVSDIYAIHINQRGELVMNDAYAYRIKIFSQSGQLIDAYGRGYGSNEEYLTFDDPPFTTQAPNGDLYIPSYYTSFTQVLRYIGDTAPASPTAPSGPRNMTADTAIANQAHFSWLAPTSDGGAALSHYTLEYKPASSDTWTPVTITAPATTHTLTGLAAGQYTARLSATNSAGTSSLVSLDFTITATPPTDPNPDPDTNTDPVTPPPTNSVTPPATPPTPSTNTVTPARSNTVSSNNPHLSVNQPPANQPATAPREQPSSPQLQVATSPTGAITISWQPPQGSTPSGYVIEYRDAAIASSNTTAPWRQAAVASARDRSHTLTLPSGNYVVRVAALMPGDTDTRVIVGVARVTIAAHTASAPATAMTNESLAPWARISIALGSAVALFLIGFIVWKRRAARARKTTTPPRWQ